jgi:hypothetical protein
MSGRSSTPARARPERTPAPAPVGAGGQSAADLRARFGQLFGHRRPDQVEIAHEFGAFLPVDERTGGRGVVIRLLISAPMISPPASQLETEPAFDRWLLAGKLDKESP